MAKKINITINKCSECPYFQHINDYVGCDCNLLDEKLSINDYHKDNEYIIYENCPLEDE